MSLMFRVTLITNYLQKLAVHERGGRHPDTGRVASSAVCRHAASRRRLSRFAGRIGNA